VRYRFAWIVVAAVSFSFPALPCAQTVDRLAGARVPSLSEDQSPARGISGTLLDPSGAAIAKAHISLSSSDGNLIAEATTDNSGSFRFEHIAPGNYTLDFQAEGFRETRVKVSLNTQRQTPIRAVMQIAVLNESITVATGDSAPSVSTENSENQNANTIDRNALDQVPVFDQDYNSTMSRFLDVNATATNGITPVGSSSSAKTSSLKSATKAGGGPFSGLESAPFGLADSGSNPSAHKASAGGGR